MIRELFYKKYTEVVSTYYSSTIKPVWTGLTLLDDPDSNVIRYQQNMKPLQVKTQVLMTHHSGLLGWFIPPHTKYVQDIPYLDTTYSLNPEFDFKRDETNRILKEIAEQDLSEIKIHNNF